MIEIANFGWIFTQILLAFLVVLILYVITLIVLSVDALLIVPSYKVKQREESVIRTGNASSAVLAKTRFNTIFPFAKGNYVKIPQSVNGSTGAQFTYQFWLKVNDTNDDNFKDLVLLLKGDDKKYKTGFYEMGGEMNLIQDSQESPKYMIKCPLIKFKDSYKNMVVEFNTNKHPDVQIEINMDKKDDDMRRKNLLSLLPLDWFLMTFVFEENYSQTEGTENGIRFTFYINDIPFQSNSGSTDLILRNNFIKQNDGDLFILPNHDTKNDILTMSDIKYFNYAKTDSDVRYDFEKRAKTFADSEKSQKLFTSF
jgi:hypothetical protein